jgi:hypothetical protein
MKQRAVLMTLATAVLAVALAARQSSPQPLRVALVKQRR